MTQNKESPLPEPPGPIDNWLASVDLSECCAAPPYPTSLVSISSFQESNYETIQSGISLDPVNYSFTDQARISAHLQKLAQMNHDRFVEVATILSREQQRLALAKEQFTEIQQIYDKHDYNETSTFWFCGRYHAESLQLEKDVLRLKKVFWESLAVHAEGIINAVGGEEAAPHLKNLKDTTSDHYEGVRALEKKVRDAGLEEGGEDHESCYTDAGCDPGPLKFGKEFLLENRSHTAIWGQMMDGLRAALSTIHERMQDSLKKVRTMQHEVSELRKEEARLIAASKFAEDLSILSGPFDLFRLPRELRNLVYGLVLPAFPYNISATEIRKRKKYDEYSYQNEYVQIRRLWTHPVLQTNRALRREAGEEFYKWNCFSTRSFATLSLNLGSKILPEFFRNNIKTLAVPWPSLGKQSIVNVKAIKTLKILRSLTIYLNWGQLLGRCENSLGGIDAFQSLIGLPNSKLPNRKLPLLQKVDIFEIQLIRRETDILAEIVFHNYNNDAVTAYYPRYPREGPPKVGLCPKEHLELTERKFDEHFSHRVLNTQTPGTTYTNDREPLKPSLLWPKKARKAIRKARPHLPIAVMVESSTVQQNLEAMRSTARERRERRIEMVEAYRALLNL